MHPFTRLADPGYALLGIVSGLLFGFHGLQKVLLGRAQGRKRSRSSGAGIRQVSCLPNQR
jgi:hypothetical protein